MKVTLLAHSPSPERVVAAAAKLCYAADSTPEKLFDGLTEDKTAAFVEKLAALGHESPIEHVSFTFGLEGVSRTLLAEITRHRIASFSVQSQRYVKKGKVSVIIPPAIAEDAEACAIFEQTMAADWQAYNQLADILQKKHYAAFLANGDSEKAAASKAEKRAIEDARFVLPNACDTQMILTMNARSLLNFFRLRCCNRAQWEIRAVAEEMLRLVCEVAPTLFAAAGPPCYAGNCAEGAMSCKSMAQMREKYTAIHAKAKERHAMLREEPSCREN